MPPAASSAYICAPAASKSSLDPNSSCAVLPVKHFDDAKQRLDRALNAGTRRALAEAMVSDVLHALLRLEIAKAAPERVAFAR